MKITLRVEGREDQRAEVQDDQWVTASIEAAWAWCRYTCSEQVTAIAPDGARIATVGLTMHDE